MVALRAGLSHARRDRHRSRLRLLVIKGTGSNSMRQKDSDDLVRVGPGTTMGKLMRQYWMPAAMSSELKADGEPMRLMLLGEQLIAFRDSAGRVGVMDQKCPHRF